MSTFTWIPDQGARQTIKPTVLKAQFGDGYEQRVGDGINTMPRSWALSFTSTPDKANDISAFLASVSGVSSFDWTPPVGTSGKFVCETWDHAINTFFDHTVSATFREVFE